MQTLTQSVKLHTKGITILSRLYLLFNVAENLYFLLKFLTLIV